MQMIDHCVLQVCTSKVSSCFQHSHNSAILNDLQLAVHHQIKFISRVSLLKDDAAWVNSSQLTQIRQLLESLLRNCLEEGHLEFPEMFSRPVLHHFLELLFQIWNHVQEVSEVLSG